MLPLTAYLLQVRFREYIRLVDRVRLLVYIYLSTCHAFAALTAQLRFSMSLPTSPALQQLQYLNASSSEFQDQLSNALYGEEYQRCVQDLQGDDLVWLVDYLDKVCCLVTFLYPPPKLLKALGDLDASGPAFRKCLRELKTVCGTGGILPTSYTLLSHLLDIGPEPFTSGGFGDVYQGTHNGSRVCIKRVRSYTSDDPKSAARVCH